MGFVPHLASLIWVLKKAFHEYIGFLLLLFLLTSISMNYGNVLIPHRLGCT